MVMDIYDFIKEYCQCSGLDIGPKAAEGYYQFFKEYCQCKGCMCVIPMLTTTGAEPDRYPVNVVNVELEVVGLANDKAEYIIVWNLDSKNSSVGILSGATGLFSFTLLAKDCEHQVSHVLGNPPATYNRLFEDAFESLFE